MKYKTFNQNQNTNIETLDSNLILNIYLILSVCHRSKKSDVFK